MAIETYVSDLVTAMNSEISGVLGSDYLPLAHVINVERNNFRQSNDRYGVLHGAASQLPGVTRNATFIQSFQIILTKGYRDSSVSDGAARDYSMSLYGKMLEIHRQLIKTKAGLPSIVLNVQDTISISDPEYIEEEKVTILRADVEIQYRFDLI